ncbi:MAG: TlpA disulfide reductase family protein [Acidobacteriota bacterium]
MKSKACDIACLIVAVALWGCGDAGSPENAAAESGDEISLVGSWRAVLSSPGGELPFTLSIQGESEAGELTAVAHNGAEEAPFSRVERSASRVTLHMDWYDAEITADLAADGESMQGTWRKTIPDGNSSLPFRAVRGDERRFLPAAEAAAGGTESSSAASDITGDWAAELTDDDGTEVARAEFSQQGDVVTGTFLTPTGDYRFLEGSFENGLLRLSTFDGAHAFLFQASLEQDGSLTGDFWSRDTYHATWTARRAEEGEQILPDAWQEVQLTNEDGKFAFEFPDLEGNPLSLADSRFAGKVVLVNIFGSWCPNCNDEAPLLAQWYREYQDQGLEIVGLAYEFSGDPERDRVVVGKFAERHGIEYPLLLAGISDKAAAGATLPDLTAVLSYPTTVFIGRDGKVRRIHSGFSGPGTGDHYDKLVAKLESTIEELLAESV